MASADALVHGCEAETFCLVAAEARASGIPLIVPDRGAAVDQLSAAPARLPSRQRDLARAGDRPLHRSRPRVAARRRRRASQVRTMDEHFADLFARYRGSSCRSRCRRSPACPTGVVGTWRARARLIGALLEARPSSFGKRVRRRFARIAPRRETRLRPSDPRSAQRPRDDRALPAEPRSISAPPLIGSAGRATPAIAAASEAVPRRAADGRPRTRCPLDRRAPAALTPWSSSAAQASRLRALFDSRSRAAMSSAIGGSRGQQRRKPPERVRAESRPRARSRSSALRSARRARARSPEGRASRCRARA